MSQRKAVFSDVDGTLLLLNSAQSFLSHFLQHKFGDAGAHKFQEIMRVIMDMTQNGVPRENLNKMFYKNFKGLSRLEMEAHSQIWFDSILNENIFYDPMLDVIQNHLHENSSVYFVSGAFSASLQPLARYFDLDVANILCTKLVEDDNIYTGELLAPPVIGEGKVYAIQEIMQTHKLNGLQTYVYGDHISDLPMLKFADRGFIVNGDQDLVELAESKRLGVIES